MENEKIKIYTTKRVSTILEKDAETFEFFKNKNYALNKNAFLTELILNYFNQFEQSRKHLNTKIFKILDSNIFLQKDILQNLSSVLTNEVQSEMYAEKNEKFNNLISLKPTKKSEQQINYIQSYLLKDCSLSEYFRNMLTSYSLLPQDKREEIIFKPQFDVISKAIKTKRKIFITTFGNNRIEASPYQFAITKEEIHLYLLFQNKNGNMLSIKLSRIKSATILNQSCEFNDLSKDYFNKMIEFGPQYPLNETSEKAVVKLTSRGLNLFHKIYTHRPIPESMQENIYTFSGSHMQVFQYFTRFGKDAEIISPLSLRDAMKNFHKGAFVIYANENDDKLKDECISIKEFELLNNNI
jgi:hypothetical protein